MNLPQSSLTRPSAPPTNARPAEPLSAIRVARKARATELQTAIADLQSDRRMDERSLVALLLLAIAPNAEVHPTSNLIVEVENTLRALAMHSEIPSDVTNVLISCATRLEAALELFLRTEPLFEDRMREVAKRIDEADADAPPDSRDRSGERPAADAEEGLARHTEARALISEARRLAEELQAERQAEVANALGALAGDATGISSLALRLGFIAEHLRDAESMWDE